MTGGNPGTSGGTAWGYARVSTSEQSPEMQLAALRAAGIDDEHLVVEQVSGAAADRPALAGLLAECVPGDSLTVWKIDRLGRSLPHLLGVIEELAGKDVEFRSVTESLDTTTPAGRLVLSVLGAMAQFERDLIVERTRAGQERARARGVVMGRASQLTPEQVEAAVRLQEGGASHRKIAATVGASKATVGRLLRCEIPSLVQQVTEAREASTAQGSHSRIG